MNYRNAYILAAICSLLMVLSILLAGAVIAAAPASADTGIGQATGIVSGQGTCAEDDPCWNWRTMGNRSRGIVTKAGNSIVVNGFRFDRIRHAGRIDWKRTRHLLGDHKVTRDGSHFDHIG